MTTSTPAAEQSVWRMGSSQGSLSSTFLAWNHYLTSWGKHNQDPSTFSALHSKQNLHPMSGGWVVDRSPFSHQQSPGVKPQQQVTGGRIRSPGVLLLLGKKALRQGAGARIGLIFWRAPVWSGIFTLLSREEGKEGVVLVQISEALIFFFFLLIVNSCFLICYLSLGSFPVALNGWFFFLKNLSSVSQRNV